MVVGLDPCTRNPHEPMMLQPDRQRRTEVLLENKNAVIYGAGGGIGGTAARALASAGATTPSSNVARRTWEHR